MTFIPERSAEKKGKSPKRKRYIHPGVSKRRCDNLSTAKGLILSVNGQGGGERNLSEEGVNLQKVGKVSSSALMKCGKTRSVSKGGKT